MSKKSDSLSSEPTVVQIRNTLRQTFRERRRRLSLSEQKDAANKAVEMVLTHRLLDGVKRIAIYKNNDGELNTDNLIEYCWQQGIDVFLPVLHPFSDGHLLFLRYTEQTAMRANLYGILEPVLDVTKVSPLGALDVIFAPLVAFDEMGNRIGMGGGFYDRTLSSLARRGHKTKVIGLAHDIQRTFSLPIEAWDIPLPAILTPSKFFQF